MAKLPEEWKFLEQLTPAELDSILYGKCSHYYNRWIYRMMHVTDVHMNIP